MLDKIGRLTHLRRMAERCRRAAEATSGDAARELEEIAEGCERSLAEQERVDAILQSEED